MTIPTTFKGALTLAIALVIATAALAVSGLSTDTASAKTRIGSSLGACSKLKHKTGLTLRGGNTRVGLVVKRARGQNSMNDSGSVYVCTSARSKARVAFQWNGTAFAGDLNRPSALKLSSNGRYLAIVSQASGPADAEPIAISVLNARTLRPVAQAWTVSNADQFFATATDDLVVSDTGYSAWIATLGDSTKKLFALVPGESRSRLVTSDLDLHAASVIFTDPTTVQWESLSGPTSSASLSGPAPTA